MSLSILGRVPRDGFAAGMVAAALALALAACGDPRASEAPPDGDGEPGGRTARGGPALEEVPGGAPAPEAMDAALDDSEYMGAPAALGGEAGEAVWRRLEAAPWVSPGHDGPALYVISFRACAPCTFFKEREFETLHAAGVDTRVLLYAPQTIDGTLRTSEPGEAALLAALYESRDWALYEAWYAPDADAETLAAAAGRSDDAEAAEAAAAGYQVFREVAVRFQPLVDRPVGAPAFVWRENGETLLLSGVGAEERARIRRGLGVE